MIFPSGSWYYRLGIIVLWWCLLQQPAQAWPTFTEYLRGAVYHAWFYRDADLQLRRSQENHHMQRAGRGLTIAAVGDGRVNYDEDQNLYLTFDVPGYETERSRYEQANGKVVLDYPLLIGTDLQLSGGLKKTDFSTTTSQTNTTRRVLAGSFDQPIFQWRRYISANEQADLQLNMAKIEYIIQSNDYVKVLLESYQKAILAAFERECWLGIQPELRQWQQMLEVRHVQGEVREHEAQLAALAVREAELSYMTAHNAAENMARELERQTGVRVTTGDSLALTDWRKLLYMSENLRNCMTSDTTRHPVVLLQQTACQVSEMELRDIRAANGVQASIFGNASFEYGEQTRINQRTSSWQVGVKLNMPLYDSGQENSEEAVAAMQLQAERARLENIAAEVRERIDASYNDWEFLAQREKLQWQSYEQQVKELNIKRRMYEMGELSFSDLLQYRRSLMQQEMEAIRNTAEVSRAIVAYLVASGEDAVKVITGESPADCYE